MPLPERKRDLSEGGEGQSSSSYRSGQGINDDSNLSLVVSHNKIPPTPLFEADTGTHMTLGVGRYGFEFHWVHMILNFEYRTRNFEL